MKHPEIIYKDQDFLVLNKPAGMIVNNADTSKEAYTVQDFIRQTYPDAIMSEDDSEFARRGGIVHRLDKETSGVLLVALNEEIFSALQKQFKERTVIKEYIALCHGKLATDGEINVPIGRLPWNRMRFGVIPQGRESLTKFQVIEYKKLTLGKSSEVLTLVRVFPKTGRTHQIRVHFQYAGFPIFADSLYAGRKTIVRDRKLLGRHFLHASKITLNHPKTMAQVEFEAPLSSELVDFLAQLT
ncbi:MAG: RluA family pseudouridine synthase [Candidatus Levybacteria bacterium]|nr:RluA family pseudouridine synthase [Candidatus Levybacteria bacterium]